MDLGRTHFSFKRPLSSYGKVQSFVSWLIRSRAFQLRRSRGHAYLNLGCGPNVRGGFLNLDYQWRPGVVCWNVMDGLPVASASLRGVFMEHCLEHFTIDQGYALLGEVHRALAPGGLVRIVVPDGRLYLQTYAAFDTSAGFPYQEGDGFRGIYTPMMSVNRVFYVQRDEPFGHNFIYDFETLSALLRSVGFADIRRVGFGQGGDPKLLIDSAAREVESLYVEAQRAPS